MKLLVDILGWIGMVLYLVAYGLISLKKVGGDSNIYQGINILAGLLLITNSFYWRAYPSAALNVVWIGIALFTLGRQYGVSR
jgi:hypothetical protein